MSERPFRWPTYESLLRGKRRHRGLRARGSTLAALGLGISAIITVRLARQSPADIEEFLTAVRRHPEITECLLVTGNLDYILRIRVEDVDALKTFILTKLKPISCVSETSTVLILDSLAT